MNFAGATFEDQVLTFHLGNDIAWAAMIEYPEHNLSESLAAIGRMRAALDVVSGGVPDRYARMHFAVNAPLANGWMRKAKRVPGFAQMVLWVKRAMGRQF